jgi:hypothetical protein
MKNINSSTLSILLYWIYVKFESYIALGFNVLYNTNVLQLYSIIAEDTVSTKITTVRILHVPDPSPWDPYVFGPPGSGRESNPGCLRRRRAL